MTWTAEQEREYQAKRVQKRELDEAYGRLYDERERQVKRLAELIYACATSATSGAGAHAIKNADALIALLRPFAGEPAATEPAAVAATGDAEGWIENTGRQPVADGMRVDIRFKSGDQAESYASHVDWAMSATGSDITHWRLHKPQESKA
jgi:hypothetical protein